MTRVYRLVIEYPPTSHPSLPDYDWDWKPTGWGDDTRAAWAKYRIELAAFRARVALPSGPFDGPSEPLEPEDMPWTEWPQNRLYLSRSGAKSRADLFRRYGAKVTIEQSAPVDGWAPITAGGPAREAVG